MLNCSRSGCQSDDKLDVTTIFVSVVGLSGPSQIKGVSGVGKSSLCNRIVRPQQYGTTHSSVMSPVDFFGSQVNGSQWIYWNSIEHIIDSRRFSLHFVERTVFISEQTFQPFNNYCEIDYLNEAVSDRVCGPKTAYISQTQFAIGDRNQPSRLELSEEHSIDVFVLAYDVSEVSQRDSQIQDHYAVQLLSSIVKMRKPIIIVATKCDAQSDKVRARLNTLLDKRAFRQIPVVETSAKQNINVVPLIPVIIAMVMHRPVPFASHKAVQSHIETYVIAAEKRGVVVEQRLNSFKRIVQGEVLKFYHVSWTEFCAQNDIADYLNVIDKHALKLHFENFKATALQIIKESMLISYLVLFKKLLFEFLPDLVKSKNGDHETISSELLQNKDFLRFFQEKYIDEEKIIEEAHLTGHINYPLPRFLISAHSQSNKLKVIDICITEIEMQNIRNDFLEKFNADLNENSDAYLDMSFSQVEKKYKNHNLWNHFRDTVKMVFEDFIDSALQKFKIEFNDKLLELSLMIFSSEMVQNFWNLSRKHKKDKIEINDLIELIDRQIYFEHDIYKKAAFIKERRKLIIKYIGSLLSTDDYQCYLSDLNSHVCRNRFLDFLNSFTKSNLTKLNVISVDERIDALWQTNVEPNITSEKNQIKIHFIPSHNIIDCTFHKNQFSISEQVVLLVPPDNTNASDIIHKISTETSVSTNQLSIIRFCNQIINFSDQYSNLIPKQCIPLYILDFIHFEFGTFYNLLQKISLEYIEKCPPITIWIITLCDELNLIQPLLQSITSLLMDCSLRNTTDFYGLPTISAYYSDKLDNFPHKINISILSFHQAFKLLISDIRCSEPKLMLYACNIKRLASINTMFALMHIMLRCDNKSVICALTLGDDDADLIEKRKMVDSMAYHRGVDCIIFDTTGDPEIENEQIKKLLRYVTGNGDSCRYDMESKEMWRLNDAYENDESIERRRSGLSGNFGDIVQQNIFDLSRPTTKTDNHRQNAQLSNQSNSLDSGDAVFTEFDVIVIDMVDSCPIGRFNEDSYCAVKSESQFSDFLVEPTDKSSIVVVNCTNKKHIERNLYGTEIIQKCRSFSGPVDTTKRSSKKYSSLHNAFSRSQRNSAKNGHSVSTSPLMSSLKSNSKLASSKQCEYCKSKIEYCSCSLAQENGVANTSPNSAKSIKQVFSRFFSSERYNTKSADDKRSIFRQSFKLPKRGSDRKTKTIPNTHSADSNVLSIAHDFPSCYPQNNNTSLSVSDSRNRTKSKS